MMLHPCTQVIRKFKAECEHDGGLGAERGDALEVLGAKPEAGDALLNLHSKFRTDLDELRDAAREAAFANVDRDAAGGWKLEASLALAPRDLLLDEDPTRPPDVGGWAPFSPPRRPGYRDDAKAAWRAYDSPREKRGPDAAPHLLRHSEIRKARSPPRTPPPGWPSPTQSRWRRRCRLPRASMRTPSRSSGSFPRGPTPCASRASSYTGGARAACSGSPPPPHARSRAAV